MMGSGSSSTASEDTKEYVSVSWKNGMVMFKSTLKFKLMITFGPVIRFFSLFFARNEMNMMYTLVKKGFNLVAHFFPV